MPKRVVVVPITVVASVDAQLLDYARRSLVWSLLRPNSSDKQHWQHHPDNIAGPALCPSQQSCRCHSVVVVVKVPSSSSRPEFPSSPPLCRCVDNTHSNYANGRVGVIINVLRGSWVSCVFGESVDESVHSCHVFTGAHLPTFEASRYSR